MKYCSHCGAEIADQAVVCPKCGCAQTAGFGGESPKGWVATLLLCFFFGCIGAHRFYVGKVGTGLLMLFTLGLFGIWTLIDFIVILCGNFKDGNGLKIKNC